MKTSCRMALRAVLVLSSALGSSAPSSAQDKRGGAVHAHELSQPQYGGTVAEVQGVTYELLVRPDGAVIYVTDHGRPVPTRDADGSIVLLSGARTAQVALVPTGLNELRGQANLKTFGSAKALATIALAGRKPVTVRFTVCLVKSVISACGT